MYWTSEDIKNIPTTQNSHSVDFNTKVIIYLFQENDVFFSCGALPYTTITSAHQCPQIYLDFKGFFGPGRTTVLGTHEQ